LKKVKFKNHSKYEVYEDGTIISFQRDVDGKKMTPTLGKNGYYTISLVNDDGKPKKHYIHRLIAKGFIPEGRIDQQHVNHKDLDKTNNSISNLEWVTHSENMKHAVLNGVGMTNNRKVDREVVLELYSTYMSMTEPISKLAESVGYKVAWLAELFREIANDKNEYSKYKEHGKLVTSIKSKQASLDKTEKSLIFMLDKNTKDIVKVFTSLREVKKYLNISNTGQIVNCINGKGKSSRGYSWKRIQRYSWNFNDYRKHTNLVEVSRVHPSGWKHKES